MSWNIAGKYEYFRSNILQNFINRYDLVCLTETHAIQIGKVNFTKFKKYEFPDTTCNYEHPRGGLLIKIDKLQFIKNVKLLMTDFIVITFTNASKLVYLYIPPLDSVYYDEQYIQLLCSLIWEADCQKFTIIAMGDTNTRLGDLSTINKAYIYDVNPDVISNENGKHLRELLFNSTSAMPVNHITEKRKFDGGFTFDRYGKQSQIDWCFCSKYGLPDITGFTIIRNNPQISDHKPIVATIDVKGEKSIDALVKAAVELNAQVSNHSKVPVISKENTNLQCLNNLLKIDVDRCDVTTMNSNEISQFLVTSIQKYGKITKLPTPRSKPKEDERKVNIESSNEKVSLIIENKDIENWKYIRESKDSKCLWNSINMKGEIKQEVSDDIQVDELARFCSRRSRIDVTQAMFTGITTDVVNADLDHDMDEKEIEEAVSNLNSKSKTSDGIAANTLKMLLPTIINMLIVFLNLIFKGGAKMYPANWLNFINAIPKKGRLELPNYFESAFELVSRKILFEKLVSLGISGIMLNALIAIYAASISVVEHRGEFSDYVVLLAGIKQGAPPSGILYIAYTLGIINVYDNTFNAEPLIFIYHLLMHADDILMLATSRSIAVEKLQCLMSYCKDNFIKLQLSKCSIMCVNSRDFLDNQPMQVNDVTLKNVTHEVYLGSVITNSNKLVHDVIADIKLRQISVVKFFAFLKSNKNAPISIKLKVLESCVISSILHNAETWADSRIERLEVIYRRMLKAILGVRITTCSEMLYVELGVSSMKTRLLIKQWKFWKKVRELNDTEPLGYVISTAKQHKLKEVRHYEDLVANYASVDEIKNKFEDDQKRIIRSKAEKGRSKYVTYLTINPYLQTPKIYEYIKRHNDRSVISKLRVSSHNLQVEMGRRTATPRQLRKCHCGEVEDEVHFLLRCQIYFDIREKYKVNPHSKLSLILDDNTFLPYIKEIYDKRNEIHG